MKNTRFSVFVAALLCVVIALSSCTGSASLPSGDELANDRINEGAIVPVEDEGTGEGDDTTLPEIDTTTTSGKIAVWQKYLGYKESVDSVVGKTNGLNLYINNNEYESSEIDSFGLVVRTYEKEEELTAEEDVGKIKITEGFAIFNPYVKSEALFSKQSYSFKADEVTGNPVQQVTRVSWDEKSYGVFVIKYEAWEAVYEVLPEGSTEAPDILGYEIKQTTYDIYLCDGTKIAEGVTSTGLRYGYFNNHYAVFYDGNVYLLDDQGRLAQKVAEELLIYDPFLSADVDDFMKLGAYYVGECGNGTGFFNENGILLSVLEYEALQGVNDIVVLPNGKILMQSFDYNYSDPKIETSVFDPATGKITAVEFNYVIENSIDMTSETMTVADGFVFVEAYAVENGVAATELSYLVLKADLTVEATLPEIVMNQSGAIEFVDSDTFLVPATVGESVYAYRVTDGNFYAFDFEIIDFYNGMLKVRDADGDVNIVDMNGKVIVADVQYTQLVQSSVLVRTYDEEDAVTKYTVCYYDAEDDTVYSRNIYTSDEDDRSFDYDIQLDGKLIVLSYRRYDSYYENDYSYREYYNAEGAKLYSFSYTSRYGNVYEYGGSGSTTTYTVDTVEAHDAIVILVEYEDGRSSTEYDYIRYDIIK